MVVVLVVALLVFCIFVGVPIAFSLGVVAIVGAFATGNMILLHTIPQQVFGGINYFPLLAIPLFILAGELMNKGQITERLVRFACILAGRLPGALAHGNILASMFFGGITGSGPADASAIGSVLIPAMKKEGYSAAFSAAVTANASTMGPIIPPSIIMVMYAATVNTSIGGMFAGGVIPGIMLAIGMMLVVVIIDRFRKLPRRAEKVTFKEVALATKGAIPALIMPLIVVGGIWGGVFTATEAAAIAVMYSLIAGFFILKTLTISDLFPMLKNTALVSSSVLLIVGIAKMLTLIFATLQVPQILGRAFMQVSGSATVFLLLVNIFLLILGMFMDAGASVLLLAPIFAPIATMMGISPLHFGLIMTINLTLGMATPPVGLSLFIVTGIAEVPLEKIAREIWPFLLIDVVVLLIITYSPGLTLFLPRLMGFVH